MIQAPGGPVTPMSPQPTFEQLISTSPTQMEMEATNPVYSSPTTSISEDLSYADISMETNSSKLSSPASTPGSSLSVQAYTSQFIKEGLKIKMRQRLSSGSAIPSPIKENVTMSSELEEYSKPKIKRIKLEDLAPEDMVKRQRRRERNKVAATKCRNKKKARTVNLMKESETLDAQNKALKIEITKLEAEKSRLIDVLSRHQPNCVKKLKDTMSKSRTSSSASQYAPEFRVPLPPTSTITSATGSNIPRIRISAPAETEDEPPSFADLIKEEAAEEDHPYMTPTYNDYNNYSNYAPTPNHFLAKAHLGQTYLDLDSRCIAL